MWNEYLAKNMGGREGNALRRHCQTQFVAHHTAVVCSLEKVHNSAGRHAPSSNTFSVFFVRKINTPYTLYLENSFNLKHNYNIILL